MIKEGDTPPRRIPTPAACGVMALNGPRPNGKHEAGVS